MKWFLTFSVCLIAFSCLAATSYYVDPVNGTNANTGLVVTYTSGTTGPWKTIAYALAHSTGGDTVWLEDGTYAEAGGINPSANYASMFILASYTANPNNVTINSSSGSYNLLSQASNITYSNLGFSLRTSADNSAIRVSGGTNVIFTNCLITLNSPGVSQPGININQSSSALISNVQFLTCSVVQNGNSTLCFGIQAGSTFANSYGPTFSNCTVSTAGRCFYSSVAGAHDWKWVGGSITCSNSYGLYMTAVTNFVFTNVTITAQANTAVNLNTAMSSNVVFSSCNITSTTTDGMACDAVVGLVIEKCNVKGVGHGIMVGLDAIYDTSQTVLNTGSIVGNWCQATTGHGMLIGDHCGAVSVLRNNINGADYSLVMKACGGPDIEQNVINGGTTAAALFKETRSGLNFQHNTVYASYGHYGITAQRGDSPFNPVGGTTNSYNWVICPSVAAAINWTANDAGGSVCDYNTYYFTGPVKIGCTNSLTASTTFPTWLTNWASYTPAGNESHSTFGPTFSPGYAQ